MKLRALLLVVVALIGVYAKESEEVDKVWLSLQVPEQVRCPDNRAPAYLMTVAKDVATEWGSLVYLGLTEEQCHNMCTDNKDPKGAFVLCASAIYHHETLNCTISRRRPEPRGDLTMRDATTPTIIFDKFCLDKKADLRCNEANFVRVDQAILPGYAYEALIAESLDDCVNKCVMYNKTECKAVMYYYKDRECILSGKSTADPKMLLQFVVEPKERVIYVENGCTEEAKASARIPKVPRRLIKKTEPEKLAVIDSAQTIIDKGVERVLGGKSSEEVKGPTEVYEKWSDWSGCTNGYRVRIRSCAPGAQCKGPFIERSECLPWSEWTICLPFPEDILPDKCIGFQRRDCITDPSKCIGHRFRYCVMPGCNGATETKK